MDLFLLLLPSVTLLGKDLFVDEKLRTSHALATLYEDKSVSPSVNWSKGPWVRDDE